MTTEAEAVACAATAATAAMASERWQARFVPIWIGQALSLFGSALVQFALVWWLTRETGSATVLATATLVALLPQIVLGPFAGALVDRWNRRAILILADASIAAATGVLIWLFATGRIEVWHVYVILAVRSLGGAFHQPAMAASTSLLVPHGQLTRVAGANQFLHGALTIVAPPTGALLVGLLSTAAILAIDVGTAALAVLPLLAIDIPSPPGQAAARADAGLPSSYARDVRAGVAYVAAWRGLSWLILLAMLLNLLLSPSSALLPLLILKEFGGGPVQLGWVESALGLGILAGGLLLGLWGGFRKRILTSLAGILVLGTAIVAAGLTPADRFALLLAAFFAVGAGQVLANGPIVAILQSTVHPDYQGRVFSLVGAGAGAMMPLGLLLAGPIADLAGVRAWFVAGGGICVVVCLLALRVPAIMDIEGESE